VHICTVLHQELAETEHTKHGRRQQQAAILVAKSTIVAIYVESILYHCNDYIRYVDMYSIR